MIAERLSQTPGVWRRAGQSGMVCGFDWVAVAALIPVDCDRERVEALLRAMEHGVLAGAIEAAEDARLRAQHAE